MGNKGHSDRNIWGGYDHYDSKGNKIGSSEPSLFGGYTNYDAKGRKIGHSDPGIFGGYTHYDNQGHKTGHSDPGIFGGYQHYDSNGKSAGSSDPDIFGGYSNNSGGCYIATCVYGSYDTPEVWTLRRFRDTYLGQRAWGRAFIRTYYTVSPSLVAMFGRTAWFRCFWQRVLNRFVAALHKNGYDDSPYTDTDWRTTESLSD